MFLLLSACLFAGETHSLAWMVLLDALRYLIVFNPIVLCAAQFVLYLVY